MRIGFKYVNKEEGNKDLYIFPVGKIRTKQFLLQQGRFRSDIRISFLTISIAKRWNGNIENLHLLDFLRTVTFDALIDAFLHLCLVPVSVTPKNVARTV